MSDEQRCIDLGPQVATSCPACDNDGGPCALHPAPAAQRETAGEAERYSFPSSCAMNGFGMHQNPDGGWVHYNDYARLTREVAALRAERDDLVASLCGALRLSPEDTEDATRHPAVNLPEFANRSVNALAAAESERARLAGMLEEEAYHRMAAEGALKEERVERRATEQRLARVREDAIREVAPLFVAEFRRHWVTTGTAIRAEDAPLLAAEILRALPASPAQGATTNAEEVGNG